MASLILVMGKVSTRGLIWCRAQNSSISLARTMPPVGEPPIDGLHAFGNRNCPIRLCAHAIGKPAVSADDGPLGVEAAVLVAALALVASQTRRCRPADAYPLPLLQTFDGVAHFHNPSRDFVPTDKRVRSDSPFVPFHAQVAVANATVLDSNLRFVRQRE
jgi:hypothetical protein